MMKSSNNAGPRQPNRGRPEHGAGFTLIELMITVAVIAILSAIAYPAYTQHITKARRADAKSGLMDLASRQERYFSVKNIYATKPSELGYTTDTAATFPINVLSSDVAYYQLRSAPTTTGSTTTFTATATPTGAQASDSCAIYVVDQFGVQSNKSTSGTTISTPGCW